MKIVMVFGGALDRDNDRKVIVGKDTAIACDLAVKLCGEASNSSTIVATAGRPPVEKWGDVWMAHLMVQYMQQSPPRLRYQCSEAAAFNTFSEASQLAAMLPYVYPRHHISHIEKVVVIAKDWHAQRVEMDCKFHFRKAGIATPIEMVTFPFPAPWNVRVRREFLARCNDRRKMIFG